MMNNKEFAEKAVKLSKKPTAYMFGAFCWPATDKNIKRLLNQYEENYNWLWKANSIKGQGYIGDCVGIIKGIAWGFDFDMDKSYGGAVYCSNGVPDIDADTLITKCSHVTTNLNNAVEGEIVWMSGHVGIVVSPTQVVECTPIGSCGVQITNLYDRGWQKKGRLPWVNYSTAYNTNTNYSPTQAAPARYFSAGYAGTYTVTSNIGVNVRTNAGTEYRIIKAIPHGSKVQNFGYYSVDKNGDKWLYVKLSNGTIGYIHSAYLK
jgi:hypothetical protein